MIVLRNLDKDRSICNGCRCLVLKISSRLLDVRILTSRSKGKRYLLPRIPFRSGSSEFPFVLRRRQFPVRLAWAMSIHKAQGQTFKRCGVVLPDPVFTHGQLYVCASRSSSAGGLRFLLGEPSAGHGYHGDDTTGQLQPYTHNVIFLEVLQLTTTSCNRDKHSDGELRSAQGSHDDEQNIQDPEFVELCETEQHALHHDLFKTYDIALVEIGAVDEAGDTEIQADPNFLQRAQLQDITCSGWAEISDRPVHEMVDFGKAVERTNDAGASSSTD